jgi:hypothetical protein
MIERLGYAYYRTALASPALAVYNFVTCTNLVNKRIDMECPYPFSIDILLGQERSDCGAPGKYPTLRRQMGVHLQEGPMKDIGHPIILRLLVQILPQNLHRHVSARQTGKQHMYLRKGFGTF